MQDGAQRALNGNGESFWANGRQAEKLTFTHLLILHSARNRIWILSSGEQRQRSVCHSCNREPEWQISISRSRYSPTWKNSVWTSLPCSWMRHRVRSSIRRRNSVSNLAKRAGGLH